MRAILFIISLKNRVVPENLHGNGIFLVTRNCVKVLEEALLEQISVVANGSKQLLTHLFKIFNDVGIELLDSQFFSSLIW